MFGVMRYLFINERGVFVDVKVIDVEKWKSKEYFNSKNYVCMNDFVNFVFLLLF